MKKRTPIILSLVLVLLAMLGIYFISHSSKPSYKHPLEAEFYRHEVVGRDLSNYAHLISLAERLLACEQGVPESALRSSRKSIKVNPDTQVALVMFKFDYGEGDDPHTAIYKVNVSPDLSCRFGGAVEYESSH